MVQLIIDKQGKGWYGVTDKSLFNVLRFIIFLGTIPLVLLVILIALLGFNEMAASIGFLLVGALILLPLFSISLFPKRVAHVLFWGESEEKKELYMWHFVIVVALLVALPVLIFFLYLIFSGSLGRGLAEL